MFCLFAFIPQWDQSRIDKNYAAVQSHKPKTPYEHEGSIELAALMLTIAC